MSEIDDLRARVQRLEDTEAIRRLKARYLNACDSQQPESARDCFAEGAIVIDMGHVGVLNSREQFYEIYKTFGCLPNILDMHHGTNSEIQFADDSHASALWALEYRNFNTEAKTVTFVSLIYHDDYAKIRGEWKITRSRSEFKTALHCNYGEGGLKPIVVGKSVAGAVSFQK
jgi:SnoaL-like domain